MTREELLQRLRLKARKTPARAELLTRLRGGGVPDAAAGDRNPQGATRDSVPRALLGSGALAGRAPRLVRIRDRRDALDLHSRIMDTATLVAAAEGFPDNVRKGVRRFCEFLAKQGLPGWEDEAASENAAQLLMEIYERLAGLLHYAGKAPEGAPLKEAIDAYLASLGIQEVEFRGISADSWCDLNMKGGIYTKETPEEKLWGSLHSILTHPRRIHYLDRQNVPRKSYFGGQCIMYCAPKTRREESE